MSGPRHRGSTAAAAAKTMVDAHRAYLGSAIISNLRLSLDGEGLSFLWSLYRDSSTVTGSIKIPLIRKSRLGQRVNPHPKLLETGTPKTRIKYAPCTSKAFVPPLSSVKGLHEVQVQHVLHIVTGQSHKRRVFYPHVQRPGLRLITT